MPKEFAHIRRLKDVVDLNLAVNPDYTPKYTGDSANYWQQDILGGKYICPITKEVVGGKTHFCYLRTCGCVMAEKAIKEIPSSTCLVCGKPFTEDDVILINGSWGLQKGVMRREEDRKGLRERMEKRRLAEKKSVGFGWCCVMCRRNAIPTKRTRTRRRLGRRESASLCFQTLRCLFSLFEVVHRNDWRTKLVIRPFLIFAII